MCRVCGEDSLLLHRMAIYSQAWGRSPADPPAMRPWGVPRLCPPVFLMDLCFMCIQTHPSHQNQQINTFRSLFLCFPPPRPQRHPLRRVGVALGGCLLLPGTWGGSSRLPSSNLTSSRRHMALHEVSFRQQGASWEWVKKTLLVQNTNLESTTW